MGVLLMAMTFGGLIVAAILLAIAWLNESAWLKKFVLGGVAIWMVFYFAMLLGASFLSTERTIEVGDTDGKAFCGFYLDCHMHTAVMKVRKAKTIGDRPANGEFYIVTVKVFSNAVKATLGFSGLKLYVIDADGRRYPHVPEVEKPEPWFDRPVPAGGSFEREVVFDLPVDVREPRLYVHDDQALLEKFLIGDEDSLFHKRSYFKLQEQNIVSSVK